ncbi:MULTISPECIES: Asp-tRNA(Asn)/Glu-tRNA(Gln) amidotransferase GatCAB subunit A [Agrobacterium]|uniref:Indoleacetamide hydrolase n=1 Tax=Agrobacterium rubi TaxID=28099 RepID=A0AAE7R8R0_9HYPH|nr:MULTISPECIES: Asp-tRNA(Asn)/Glu-tRNA(Gln) amidotransferase GatCAB subunit A [Agrobacterium]MBN7807832.1 Asp-tRNA(Asn)/Glu-tRNA(Gln) amidotransferase GatCAB subunit A [Agrobacterium rosae]NTE89792.1 Asp-tRNA(Asn)/Glu-tRNA(Gln) amidotransferase GatCAB subunit A [Agrobacterium rubi]NTF05358.1 Asp-tRNA(Asn)/Glu-tRNA(Gln) amidotransferase GatCAB subunit A [Agrobacterium rubi]NTF10486.1 Asp-tRNA(Asn)/Glu-tRNA(Gln) amidotransferase GatCAB subunit A [Agrobacterium rubi]NTF22880.1 Asp-tRNA(Asn)/Glu-
MAVTRRLDELSLVKACELLQARDVTSVTLLEASLNSIDTYDWAINSVAWLDREGAYRAAEEADKRLDEGRPSGILDGVPLAHKDIFYMRDRVCASGSALRQDFRPSYDATVLDRLASSGSYAFGGLNMAEFALNGTGHNSHLGDCCNPYDTTRVTGGSSSGSAAAVAAGFTLASLGTDTGGSVRLPASANGVTGLKPTYGRISRRGVQPLSNSMDHVGPIARTAQDCARLLTVLAGADPLDATSATAPADAYETFLDGDIRGLRIGILGEYFVDGVDDEIRGAVDATVQVFRARGAVVTEVNLPDAKLINAFGGLVARTEAAAAHAQWMRERAGEFAPHVNSRLYASMGIPATYYIEALNMRGPLLKTVLQTTFCGLDLLIAPTVARHLPTRTESDIDLGSDGCDVFPNIVSDLTRPFNYLGLPAVSAPCGFDRNGLPIGFQLVGRPFSEGMILKATDAFQMDTPWHRRRPILKLAIDALSGAA